jgi:hypothetical protein
MASHFQLDVTFNATLGVGKYIQAGIDGHGVLGLNLDPKKTGNLGNGFSMMISFTAKPTIKLINPIDDRVLFQVGGGQAFESNVGFDMYISTSPVPTFYLALSRELNIQHILESIEINNGWKVYKYLRPFLGESLDIGVSANLKVGVTWVMFMEIWES